MKIVTKEKFLQKRFSMANSKDPDERAPTGALSFGVLLFAITTFVVLNGIRIKYDQVNQMMAFPFLASLIQTLRDIPESGYVQNVKDTFTNLRQKCGSHHGKDGTTSRGQMIRLSAAVCGIELCYAAETAFVSPILLKLGVPVKFMTLSWCISPLLGFCLVPIMGSLSDRCPLKFGRRRPFILMFSFGIIIGLLLVPNGETFGILAGDVDIADENLINFTLREIQSLNISERNIKHHHNESEGILRSSYIPEWPSSLNIPEKHTIGIFLTIIGVTLLDFNCDACQSPCRTYLLDILDPSEHSRGLTSFTVMAGLGGSFGYIIGGIDWEATDFGVALGGHVKVVFAGVLVMFLVCMTLTITSFKETPLNEIVYGQGQVKGQIRKVKRAKYSRFENESSDEEYDTIEGNTINSYGTLNEETNCTQQNIRNSNSCKSFQDSNTILQSNEAILMNNFKDTEKGKPVSTDISADISLRKYLRSIIKMPRSMLILCITNLFCWMSLLCYSLYFTDFVGQSVFGGDPKSQFGSAKHDLYDQGVRLGSFGMSLYSLSCAIYSMVIDYVIRKFGARRVYTCSQLVYTVGMIILAISRHPVAVIALSPSAGIMYATLFTMPYILVAHYHSSNKFSQSEEAGVEIRGLGTDVALVSSMVFLAQFLLSIVIGSLVNLTGSTVTIVIAAAVLSFCGAISATQVTYLDL